MFWVRIDNRLIHGQIIEAWLPFTGVDRLVVANDELASDELRQEIMAMAIPENVRLSFLTVADISSVTAVNEQGGEPNTMILLANCADARRAYELGLSLRRLNVGNLHYGPGKKQLCAHVAVSGEDENCLRFFVKHGVDLDFRCVPNDTVQVRLIK